MIIEIEITHVLTACRKRRNLILKLKTQNIVYLNDTRINITMEPQRTQSYCLLNELHQLWMTISL